MSVLRFTGTPAAARVRADWVMRLGMTQLSPTGLSEQWVLRQCGDRHWDLIAAAMGQARAVFTCPEGRPVYAAFCVTALDLSPPEAALLGQDLHVASELYRVSGGLTGSVHRLVVGGVLVGCLRMVSTFVAHDDSGSNRSILRRSPLGEVDLPPAPPMLARLAEASRQRARALRERTARTAAIQTVTPCPSLDFNAVGLLYFPAFSRIAEAADWQSARAGTPLATRTVTYLGNIDQGDSISAHRVAGGLDLVRSDGCIIAHASTTRHGPKQP